MVARITGKPPPIKHPVDERGGLMTRPWIDWAQFIYQVVSTLEGGAVAGGGGGDGGADIINNITQQISNITNSYETSVSEFQSAISMTQNNESRIGVLERQLEAILSIPIPQIQPTLPFYLGVDFEIAQDGTLKFKNSGHMLYGSMYGDDMGQSVTISATGTFYEVGGGLSDGGSNGTTFQNSKELLIAVAGEYLVNWSVTIECTAAAQYVEGAVMINSTAQMNTISAAELPTANKKVALGGTGIITLAVNDVVKLSVENETATNNLTVDHANLTIVQVGG